MSNHLHGNNVLNLGYENTYDGVDGHSKRISWNVVLAIVEYAGIYGSGPSQV